MFATCIEQIGLCHTNMRTADTQQQQAITELRNTVVRASAGSGKTSVLTQRYLHLVQKEQVPVAEILCLTFTRKAAAEMHERIYNLLREQDDPFVEEQLANFEQNNISTIDSFCARIVRNNALSFGIAAAGAGETREHSELLYRQAIIAIGKNQKQAILSRIIAHRGFGSCAEKLFVPILEKYSSLAYPLDFPAIWEHVRNVARDDKQELHQAIIQNITDIMNLPMHEAGIIQRAQDTFETYAEQDSSFDDDISEFNADVHAFDLRKGVKRNNPYSDTCKDIVRNMRSQASTYLSLAFLLEEENMQEFYAILSDYQGAVIAEKLQQSIYSYHDVSELAIRMLRENLQLRQYYKNCFRYIMIDEFQDNNARQRDLLYLLAEKDERSDPSPPTIHDLQQNKLFFVGDEKQSIYRFRGADVRVFKKLAEDVEDTGGKKLHLEYNYRSTPALVRFFNDVFRKVLVKTGSEYEATYVPQSEGQATATEDAIESIITVAVHGGKEGQKELDREVLPPVQAEAWWVAEKIAELIHNKTLVQVSGEIRPVHAGDVAILFRSRTSLRHYEQALRYCNIEYSTQGTHTVFTEAAMNDLHALLRLCLFPEDRLNYACVLRSPLVQISDQSIILILQEGAAPFETELDLPPEDSDALAHAGILYRRSCVDLSNMTAMQFVFLFWYGWGYRYILLSRSDYHPYLEHYDYLMSIARAWNDSLPNFMQRIHTQIIQAASLEESTRREKTDSVQLLSIHASKGLEFPVVFVCDMASNPSSNRDALFSYHLPSHQDNVTDPLILPNYYRADFFDGKNSNYFLERTKGVENEQELAEIKRLLYVALTRAQCHLFLCAHRKRGSSSDNSHNLFHILEHALDDYPITIIPDITREEYQPAEQSRRTRDDIHAMRTGARSILREKHKNRFSVSTVSSFWNKQSKTPSLESDRSHVSKTELDSSKQDPAYAQDFGTLCHAILEHRIMDAAHTKASPETVAALNKVQILTQKYDADFFSSAWDICESFFSSPFWQEHQDSKMETEIAFTYRHRYRGESIYLDGRIDLLMETDNHITLVDFKTDRVPRSSEHHFQLALYQRVCEEIGGKSVRGWLFYLRDGGEAVEMPALDFAAVIDQFIDEERGLDVDTQ